MIRTIVTNVSFGVREDHKGENPAVDSFIEEVLAVCEKHGMSISHEDGHGGFEIEPYSEGAAEWFRDAADLTNVRSRQ